MHDPRRLITAEIIVNNTSSSGSSDKAEHIADIRVPAYICFSHWFAYYETCAPYWSALCRGA